MAKKNISTETMRVLITLAKETQFWLRECVDISKELDTLKEGSDEYKQLDRIYLVADSNFVALKNALIMCKEAAGIKLNKYYMRRYKIINVENPEENNHG